VATLAVLLSLLALPPAYRLDLRVLQRDYFLPAPVQRNLVLRLDLRRAPPKARILFQGALAAGRYQLRIEATGGADKTMVIAVPLAVGRSSFAVTIIGGGRYDLGFFGDGPGAATREYRFTVMAPVTKARTFDLEVPSRLTPP
jgi:hypothetical protein